MGHGGCLCGNTSPDVDMHGSEQPCMYNTPVTSSSGSTQHDQHKAVSRLTVFLFALKDKGNVDGEGSLSGLPLLHHLLHRINECQNRALHNRCIAYDAFSRPGSNSSMVTETSYSRFTCTCFHVLGEHSLFCSSNNTAMQTTMAWQGQCTEF